VGGVGGVALAQELYLQCAGVYEWHRLVGPLAAEILEKRSDDMQVKGTT
jgi:hypothetical protein